MKQTGNYSVLEFRKSRFVPGLLLVMASMLACMSVYVRAAVSGNVPVISVAIHALPLGYPTYSVTAGGSYAFGATIEIPTGGPLLDGDLYFGILQPGGNKALTWVKSEEGSVLLEGMSPMLEDIDMHSVAAINTTELIGHDIQYTFTGDEPPGMYLIFGLLAVADSIPSDPRNWLGVKMTPFFLK